VTEHFAMVIIQEFMKIVAIEQEKLIIIFVESLKAAKDN
jgi:hypothetical protein